jgi:hypothetical protein
MSGYEKLRMSGRRKLRMRNEGLRITGRYEFGISDCCVRIVGGGYCGKYRRSAKANCRSLSAKPQVT